jgi:alginate O-acetyltransferase complex protein AlgI
MLFPSIPYLFIFLPIVAIVLFVTPRQFQWLWLMACSTFFYYKLLPVYLILFFALILMNYYLGIAIEKAGEKRKNIFIWSIAANIAVLAFFKYFGFLESLFAGIVKLSATDRLAISE